MTYTYTLPACLVPIHPALREVKPLSDGSGYTARFKHLFFIVTIWEQEPTQWMHSSLSRRDHQTPTYADLVLLKHYCIGDHREAYQIFPTKEKHVDFSKAIKFDVLHLWTPIEHQPLPNFGRFGTI